MVVGHDIDTVGVLCLQLVLAEYLVLEVVAEYAVVEPELQLLAAAVEAVVIGV